MLIDAHIHLEQYNLTEAMLEDWRAAGVAGVVAVSTDLASSYRTLELQQKHPNFVYAAIGFHPEFPLPSDRDFLEWCRLLKAEADKISAIGEVGLPHYSLPTLSEPFEAYQEFLSRCLSIAKANKLPVALHAVHDKAVLALKLLKKHHIRNSHFHWLKAPENVVEHIIANGSYVSVTPEVCYRQRDQELIKAVPTSQLLIETDGPWTFEHNFAGRFTTPKFLPDVLRKVAEIKGTDENELKRTLAKTREGVTSYRE